MVNFLQKNSQDILLYILLLNLLASEYLLNILTNPIKWNSHHTCTIVDKVLGLWIADHKFESTWGFCSYFGELNFWHNFRPKLLIFFSYLIMLTYLFIIVMYHAIFHINEEHTVFCWFGKLFQGEVSHLDWENFRFMCIWLI